jgi:hypothetical protein
MQLMEVGAHYEIFTVIYGHEGPESDRRGMWRVVAVEGPVARLQRGDEEWILNTASALFVEAFKR